MARADGDSCEKAITLPKYQAIGQNCHVRTYICQNQIAIPLLTLNPSARFHFYWLDCRAHTPQMVDDFLTGTGIPNIDIGHSIALEFGEKLDVKHLALNVEEFLQHILEVEAKPVDQTGIPVIAISNVGILLEPELQLDAAKLLKRTAQRIGIVLLWNDACEPPGIFHWNDRKSEYKLDLTETSIQVIHLP